MQEQTKKELRDIKAIVRAVLQDEPEARQNDDTLFLMVCQHVLQRQGISIYRLTFVQAFQGDGCALPKYESVVRLRRVVQREHPELQPQEPVKDGRAKREADFVEYARKGGQDGDGATA